MKNNSEKSQESIGKSKTLRRGLMLLVLATLVAATLVSSQLVRAESISPWGATTAYPKNVFSPSCVENLSYIYCVGGFVGSGDSSLVYYAPLSTSGGVGTWTQTTSYPDNSEGLSCVAANPPGLLHSYIYCLGDGTTNVYSAQISSSGVGAWSKSTNSYPTSISYPSCVTFSGFSGFMSHAYIACIGGDTSGGHGTSLTNAIYYAEIGSGVGAWTASGTYTYNIWMHSCVLNQGHVYCIGGYTSGGYTNAILYASVGVAGVGIWTGTNGYPEAVYGQSCVVNSGYVYCIDGATTSFNPYVNYAALGSLGVGTWTSGTNYPVSEIDSSCVTYSDYIYCVAGLIFGDTNGNNQVYYSEIVHSPTTTVTVTGPTTTVSGPTTTVTGPTSTTTITALKTTTHTTTLTKTVTKTVASTTKTTTTTRTVTTHVPTATLGPSNDTGGPSAASILPVSSLAVILSAMALGGAGLFFVAVPQRLDYFRRKFRL